MGPDAKCIVPDCPETHVRVTDTAVKVPRQYVDGVWLDNRPLVLDYVYCRRHLDPLLRGGPR